jgi:hypothetical protein
MIYLLLFLRALVKNTKIVNYAYKTTLLIFYKCRLDNFQCHFTIIGILNILQFFMDALFFFLVPIF